ncbi:helix-turn-helix domain-containing protein [Halopiger goleimassiliensis]|uniref:helix-turn-helix domain-containing protein n=1 Tax=Halopiger goleimassiliensis TaxID=1293048 RepID=UPI00067779A7|nr:helix-turn-helix domain-containing protein [Halopiger goleimassiliensis]
MAGPRVIAEITLVHPELVLTPTIEAVPEVTTELEYQTIAAPGEYYLFFQAHGGDFDRFDRAVATDPTVSDPVVIVDGDEFRVYRMRLTSSERLVLPKAADLGIRVLRAESGRGGWIATLEIPEREALREFRRLCTDLDVSFTVDRLFHADEESAGEEYGLTPVQARTLVTAYEHGYFENPRGASVEDLADDLGVSSSAVSGRLRRGLGRLVENTLVR